MVNYTTATASGLPNDRIYCFMEDDEYVYAGTNYNEVTFEGIGRYDKASGQWTTMSNSPFMIKSLLKDGTTIYAGMTFGGGAYKSLPPYTNCG